MTAGSLVGKTAIVTGASRGIGAHIAVCLARAGADVALFARTSGRGDDSLPGSLQETAHAVEQAGGRALQVVGDVLVDGDLVRLVELTDDVFGGCDILVNNAAATVPGRPGRRPDKPSARSESMPSVVGLRMKSVRTQFEVNLFSAWRLIQLVLPGMYERGTGNILNISSDSAHQPGEGPYRGTGGGVVVAYGASKLALEHLTRCVAYEATGRGVAVNALAPSLPIHTPGLEWLGLPDGAWVSAESFAQAAVRLAGADPVTTNGQLWFSEDVLDPAGRRRGWLAQSPQ